MNLSELEIGKECIITNVGGEGALRQHFLDMGVIPGVRVKVVKYAPMGDPIELNVRGYELTLRIDDAKKIEVKELESEKELKLIEKNNKTYIHPGIGESGKYHIKANENPLPKETQLTFALVGNQNCGKTTLFNQLTGANQHVGNFPGVTVDQKSGEIRNYPNTLVTDLPGIYSLSPYSEEEIVSRKFILESKPTCIINIVDATNIERNLYLTMQLMELDVPIVLALNMMDEVRNNSGTININAMENLLGIPVVPVSASKNEGIDELINHAMHIARYQEKPGRIDFCDAKANNGIVHRCLHSIMDLIDFKVSKANLPLRFAASKLVEGDKLIYDSLSLNNEDKEIIEKIITKMEKERELDRAAAIADMRFTFIEKLCEETVVKPKESKEHIKSKKIDKILTGKYTAIPAFIGIMALIFFLTFNVIGAFFQSILEFGIEKITESTDKLFTNLNVNEVIHSLVIDGIFNGVGSVLSFVPIVITLFFFLSLLEDSGYMARIAFVMDKLLRKIGLSGKSIVPLLIGFGCTVPAVMATRTLASARDRKMTIILTPFMSCSAKLPIYAFFSAAFFPKIAWIIMVGLYFVGILVGILIALISKKSFFKGEPIPFVMELPNYRMPGVKNVARLLWDKTKDFIKRAFTVILVATIVIWLLQTFNFKMQIVENSKDSILASISGLIVPIFKPIGLGDWRIITSLISGFMAKESVVSSLTVMMGSIESITAIITPLGCLSLLVFCLLYTPCVAAVAVIKQELGFKWALKVVVFQFLVAWFVSFAIVVIGLLFGGTL